MQRRQGKEEKERQQRDREMRQKQEESRRMCEKGMEAVPEPSDAQRR